MFDSHTEQPRTRFESADRVINRTNGSYDSYGNMKFGSRVKKTVQKYESYRSWNGGGGVHFGGETGGNNNDDDDESGVCSPPLWKTSPTRSPNHHQPHNNNNNNYRSLSSAQKSQAVAKGQRELMEMIRNMPESSYELSLRDLVEHPRIMEHPMIETRSENIASPENNIGTGTGTRSTHDVVSYRGKQEENWKKGSSNNNNNNRNKSEKKGQIKRNETFDNGGFLLKTAFPVSWGSSNKKKSNSSAAAGTNNNTSSKVSPRPSVDGSGKISVDKEWWKKKKLSDSRDSESAGLSSNSGSTGSSGSSNSIRSSSTRSNSRRDRSCTSGCWSILYTRKGKTQN